MSEISLKEYALQHGIDPGTARQRALRGAFKTAHKVGRDWMIDADEPMVDHRYANAQDMELSNTYYVIADYVDGVITIENLQAPSTQAVVDMVREQWPEYKITDVFKRITDWK